MNVSLIPVNGIPLVKKGDDIPSLVADAFGKDSFEEGDVLVIASTIVSKAEGMMVDLNGISPGKEAEGLSVRTGKDPRLCQLILDCSDEIIAAGCGPVISKTHHGYICASAGIDTSNIAGDTSIVCPLPRDPDDSARKIRRSLQQMCNKRLAVIISDTQGRPFRVGALGVSIGQSGIDPLYRYKGKKDLYGYELHSSVIARADGIAAAADVVMGQADEGIPVVVVRGAEYTVSDEPATSYMRDPEKDLFYNPLQQ